METGRTFEFEREKEKYIVREERQEGRSAIHYGKEFEGGQNFFSFQEFMAKAKVGNQFLREYIQHIEK